MPTINHAAVIGGGDGYEHTVGSQQATTTVRNIDQLRSAMGGSSQGDVIFVPGNAQINASGQKQLNFASDGVILASDRGLNGSPGGLIYTNDYETANVDPLIDTANNDIRVTGLRFRGPESEIITPDNHHDWAATALGIREGAQNYEVDNCELFNWPGQALNIWADGVRIHNNEFHNNQMRGLGYGMELQYGFHYITCNLFYANRHGIAGVGREGNGYVARQNVFGHTNNEHGHAIDMHGNPSGGDPAGTRMIIEQNTVMRRPGNAEQVHIRGPPRESCTVRNNWFRNEERPTGVGGNKQAWWQSGVGNTLARMSVSDNHYGMSSQPPNGVGAATGAATFSFQ